MPNSETPQTPLDNIIQEEQLLPEVIDDREFLFRGVVKNNWDFVNNRITSAAFKDNFGASVDRDGGRTDQHCIDKLLSTKDFFAICKVTAQVVRVNDAIVKYLPITGNIYHSEIHDSNEVPLLRGKKPNRIREASIQVYPTDQV